MCHRKNDQEIRFEHPTYHWDYTVTDRSRHIYRCFSDWIVFLQSLSICKDELFDLLHHNKGNQEWWVWHCLKKPKQQKTPTKHRKQTKHNQTNQTQPNPNQLTSPNQTKQQPKNPSYFVQSEVAYIYLESLGGQSRVQSGNSHSLSFLVNVFIGGTNG